ncbi:MAG: symmetrical bis(5'-nucleosyl)-tetraphosphatase [Gammaproteobacteria bacterium]
MATYAIGDIQGCQREFDNLLAATAFDARCDRLWITGDLVNRGPRSLDVVRAVMQLGDAAVTVLGNHDLHLLALALLPEARLRRRDSVDDILDAPDRDDIIDWLRSQPLIHADATRGLAMVHAGLAADWSVEDAVRYAGEVSTCLRDDATVTHFLAQMYGDVPARWDPALSGAERLRFITNCLTRMRYCHADGTLELSEKGAPSADDDLLPWYAVPGRRSRDTSIVFGHWSTLRLDAAACRRYNVWPLDTGAVWGDRLTALRLEDFARFSVSSTQALGHE